MRPTSSLACFLCLFLALSFSLPALASSKETLKGPVIGEVLSVYDGDTLDVQIQVWLDQNITTKIRIDGIDTPELRGKCASEKAKAEEARQEILQLVKDRKVEIYDIRHGKYAGRVLGKIRTLDGTDIGEHMISKGLARPYQGEKRQGWCSV